MFPSQSILPWKSSPPVKLGKILDELVSRGVQIKKDKGSWDDLILSLSIRDSAHYIYDVYFDDLNPQDTNLYGTNTSSNSVVTEIAEDSTAFFKDAMYFKIRRLIYDNALGKAGCYFEKSISVEDLYYVLRNIGMDDEYINYELFKYRYSSWHGRDEKSKELLVKYQFNKLKAQYDDRIMIMPHKFHIEDNEEKYYLRHHRMNGKNLKAIFISDWEQLYFMKKNMSKFNLTRYLFIKESVLNHPYSSYEYTKKGIEEYGIKVIAVPDDIKYCELSSLLDNELALEENSDNIVLEQKVS